MDGNRRVKQPHPYRLHDCLGCPSIRFNSIDLTKKASPLPLLREAGTFRIGLSWEATVLTGEVLRPSEATIWPSGQSALALQDFIVKVPGQPTSLQTQS